MNSSHHPWDVSDPHREDDLAAEKLAAIRTIRRLMDFWQIEPEELTGVVFKAREVPSTPPRLLHRYQHPVHGATWDGRGAQPEWLKNALLKEGYTVEELRLTDVSHGSP